MKHLRTLFSAENDSSWFLNFAAEGSRISAAVEEALSARYKRALGLPK